MIKATLPLSSELIPPLEDLLCELAPCNWCLQINRLSNMATLEGFFDNRGLALVEWISLSERFPAFIEPLSLELSTVEDRDWKEAYKEHFHPWSIGPLHLVPEWERATYVLPDGGKALYVDPGMAFGTGLHETTRLCLGAIIEFFEETDLGGLSCIDVGCGSGILALSAKLLGAGNVKGVDIDPDAVRISIENATANGMGGDVSFTTNDIAGGLFSESADLVLANIQADVLCAHAELLLCAVRSQGLLALSGILSIEAKKTAELFQETINRLGSSFILRRKDEGEWTQLTLIRK
jgi:ribosomal protein L11 methyltransferase